MTHAAGLPADLIAMAEAPDASPALVDLLVHSGRLTSDALAATVVDLGARGWVHLEQIRPGEVLCRLPRSTPPDDTLTAYELMALELLRSRAVDGVVPAGALGQGITVEADRWWKQFTSAVMDAGEHGGYCRGPASWPAYVGAVGAALLLVALFAAAAVVDDRGLQTALVALWILLGLVLGLAVDVPAQRTTLTREGIELGSRWITMRERVLDLIPDDLGPAAAATRGRALAFAAAVGTAPSVVRGLPRGPDSTRAVWVRRGRMWEQVRLRYPVRMPRGWGRPPLTTVLPSLAGVLVSLAVLGATHDDIVPVLDGAALVLLVIAGSELVAGLHDVVTPPRPVEGPVVARWCYEGSRGNPWRDLVPRRWFVVIDDGSSTSLRGLRVSENAFHKAHRGDHARARVGRAQGFVHEITIEHSPQGSAPGA